MIKITALNKFYRSKKRSVCHALKNINLTLPDAGLVFVLGKSGSGKSTLLNLIGGLDNISSGSIEVDGNDLAGFKEKDFCNYRNTHIGFIFQDYHLIDELTVYENIVLSLNLRRIEDRDLVSAALAKVDLAGYEDRYPTELSGGEQQRVAIARAIVKNPRIILADEPTGNLDTHTSTAIITLLKQLSKECLILIVSHNVNDANNYADRIIKLAKGEIISDKSRNPDFADQVTLDGDRLVYPQGLALSDNDVEFINNNLTRLVKRTDKFVDTKEAGEKSRRIKIENKRLSFGKELNLSGKFLKNKTFAISLSSFMVAVIMVIMALAQTIITFNGNDIIASELENLSISGMMVQNVTSDNDRLIYGESKDYFKLVSEEDKAAYREAGYTGEMYDLISYGLPISSNGWQGFAGVYYSYFTNSPYISSTLGTLIVDEDFLVEKFGKLEYLAKLDEFNPVGVIITDYVADAMIGAGIAPNLRNYDDLLGEYTYNNYRRGFINGIIRTDYSEKHKDIFSQYLKGEFKNANELMSSDTFIKLSDEVYEKYGYCYSFNPSFTEDFAQNPPNEIIYHSKITLDGKPYAPDKQYIFFNSEYVRRINALKDFELGPNEMIMNYQKFNSIFGTEYTYGEALSEFTPISVKLVQYRKDDYNYEHPIASAEVVIVKLIDSNVFTGLVGDNIFNSACDSMLYTKGLYFNSTDNLSSVIEVTDQLGYKHATYITTGIYTMTRAVDVFIPIFELISIFLYIGVIFILMNFASKMINDKMHEIGILKALGTKNESIVIVFGLQVMLIAIFTCIMSTIGYYLFIDVANDVLVESIRTLAPNWVVMDLQFLDFKPKIAFINCILVFVLAFASLVTPMIKIKAIKPVKIIKAKE